MDMTKEQFAEILKECSSGAADLSQIIMRANEIVKTGNPDFICDFAEYVEKADCREVMSMLESGMMAIGDPYYNYEMAFCMQFAGKKKFDLARFEKDAIESGNPKIMCYFMGFVKEANIENIMPNFLKCTNTKWLEHAREYIPFGAYLSEEQIEAAEKATETHDNAIPQVLRKYTNKTDKSQLSAEDIKNLQNQVLKNGQTGQVAAYEVVELAENIEGCNREKLLDAIINRNAPGDMLHAYEFGCSVPGADTAKVIEALEDSNSVKLLWYGMEYTDWNDAVATQGCNRKMAECIRKSGNEKYAKLADETLKTKEQEAAAIQT